MIIRQLTEEHYLLVYRHLMQKGRSQPFDASFALDMNINGVVYALKLQQERHHKIAVLQALRIERGEDAPRYELLTDNVLLYSFLEILIQELTRARAA